MSADDDNFDDTGDDERLARLLAKLQAGGGASINTGDRKDPRVSSVLAWFWSALGTAFVGGVYWVASSITGLNSSVNKIADQNVMFLERMKSNEDKDERQEDHINAMDLRLVVVEQVTGVQLRGGPRSGK